MTTPIGEVYYIKNKVNGKGYVGQAHKTVGAVKLNWGTNGRWLSHLREARDVAKGGKDHCVLLNNAINKYGGDAFEVQKICDCLTIEEMDAMETKYIQEYNTKVPNGYNLTSGGGKGKDSDETREKKRKMRLGKSHTEDTKKKISKGQVGNRRTVKKYPEDSELPRYIVPKRLNGVIIGYIVQSFPKGSSSTEYITKTFNNKDLKLALQKACEYLDELYKQYPDVDSTTEPTPQEKLPIKVERTARKNKLGSDRYDIPKYVYLVSFNDEDIGFKVDSLRIINEDGSIKRVSKVFVNPNDSMATKLQMAINHIETIKRTHKCLLDDHINTSR